jgi:hypothetical protein
MTDSARTAVCIACDAIIVLRPIGVPRRHCDSCLKPYVKAKQRAHNKVIKAIYAGQLKPASDYQCVDCQQPAVVWDHRDYRAPFDVEPTCKRCNALRGPAIWEGAKHKRNFFLPKIYVSQISHWTYGEGDAGALL